MKKLRFLSLLVVVLASVDGQLTEEQMRQRLEIYDGETRTYCNRQAHANWNVQTDVGNVAYEEAQLLITVEYANYRKNQYDAYFKDALIESYNDPDIRRQLMLLKNIGTAALSDDDLNALTRTRTNMSGIYNSARICPYNNPGCNLEAVGMSLDPDIEARLAALASSGGSYDEMQYLWEEWREKSGKLMREQYKDYIALNNKAAQANGFEDAGAMWRDRYEYSNLVELVDQLWSEVEPLYNELHRYVRYQLSDLYSQINKADPLLPAHVFGNMWAQNWGHLYDLTRPFKNASDVDVTSKMLEQEFDEYHMFNMSDQFYMSMGLPTSFMSYNPPSIIKKPTDRTIACHASAWDFCDGQDFRIKQCTTIDMEDFITVHHEMGHIMYYLMYKELPGIYRTGANPGFHEAVGDTIALSVATPQHLIKVGLLENYEDSEADNINALYKMALERVAFLPFGLLIDKWRWDVFSGATPETEWNKHWWELREKYQKVKAPTTRGEEFFDPGAKYHIPADSQYIAYFVAHILEFSFYRSLCIEAGEFNPNNPSSQLHKCDFYESVAAGDKLRAGLSLGYSKHWSEALNELTGSPEISSSAIMDYFAPLYDFLKAENDKRQAQDMPQSLAAYEVEASEMCNKLVHAEWDVATDSENEQLTVEYERMVLENAEFTRRWHEAVFKGVNPDDFTDELVKRQLKYLVHLGKDALDPTDLSTLTNTQTSMENIYNLARICPFNAQSCDITNKDVTLSLDPEISEVMATSTNYDELKWTWEQWHDKSGRNMRSGYATYVELNNKAARLNNLADAGKMWLEAYEDDSFVDKVDAAWEEVEPLYVELHTYVLRKLKEIHGDKLDDSDGLIPAHLLGNMWAQSWVNLYERIKPFPDGSSIDVTDSMVQQNVSVLEMFELSDEFFKGLGLPANDMSYDESRGAVIIKPTNRTITCHASAWDFCNGVDYRIKMCTSVNQEDFVTVHHEMGHINYFLLYKDKPIVLRTGANPGFHEAVGDLIALSVSTPQHLESIGYLKDYRDTQDDNINALFKMALEKIAFIPFGLLIDKWRWDVFNGTIPESQWNKHWWDLRQRHQKLKPPTPRGEEYFDAGAKYHVPADVPYIRYFVSHILQFQFHRAACIAAGQYDPNDASKPLHKCDIQGNAAAGALIKNGLSLGLSKHWSEVLSLMTNGRDSEMSGAALNEYFKPLYDWLKQANEDYGKASSTMIRFSGVVLAIVVFLNVLL